eukprot:m.32241 g.32241  ORF g.32241 m.32241 type:complete len:91 (+) comp7021_c0_seq1:169-441(+)
MRGWDNAVLVYHHRRKIEKIEREFRLHIVISEPGSEFCPLFLLLLNLLFKRTRLGSGLSSFVDDKAEQASRRLPSQGTTATLLPRDLAQG